MMLRAHPFSPPKVGALPVTIAVGQKNRPLTASVPAVAYLDPGADILCVRDVWLAHAESEWQRILPVSDDGEIIGGVTFSLTVGTWTGDFSKEAMVWRSENFWSLKLEKRFPTRDRFRGLV